jgi:hypothetical protein
VKNSFIGMLIIVATKKGLYPITAAIITNAIIYLEFFLVKEAEKRCLNLTHVIIAATACSGTIVLKSSGKSFASGSFPPADP